MEININGAQVTTVSQTLSGYNYLHVYTKITSTSETIVEDILTISSSSYELETDGYYVISEFKLLTSESDQYYYMIGGVIYTPEGITISVEDLMELESLSIEGTRTDENIFSYYYTNAYYLDLLKSKYFKGLCGCGCVDKMDKITIDTLTMGIEVLNILIQYSQYYEAQKIIEQLATCNTAVASNCGCNG